jgi:hypothetical protein
MAENVLFGKSRTEPGSRLGATDQDVPSKCSVRVRKLPSSYSDWPATQTSSADRAVMPLNRLPTAPDAPLPPPGLRVPLVARTR